MSQLFIQQLPIEGGTVEPLWRFPPIFWNHCCACFNLRLKKDHPTLCSTTRNKCFLKSLFGATVCTFFFYFFGIILLFKMYPEHKMLFHVLNHSNSMMCCMEKLYVLDKFHPGIVFFFFS